jgi:hypothetical protein
MVADFMNPDRVPAQASVELPEEEKQERFILVALDQFTYVFPSPAVWEILLVDRNKVLHLPYYNSALLGVIDHQSQIVPLVVMRQILEIPSSFISEVITVVRLSDRSKHLGGVGLVFDKTLGSCLAGNLPAGLLTETSASANISSSNFRLFRPELISPRLWRPTRWL